jgi:hypothetical protein
MINEAGLSADHLLKLAARIRAGQLEITEEEAHEISFILRVEARMRSRVVKPRKSNTPRKSAVRVER